tara:strand:- start:60702 stop:61985 length:1284 start_codon:yes stop_codon:yes gene_type:complete
MTTTNPQYRYPLQPWVVVLCSSLFFFYEFIQMNMPNSINTQLMQAFHVGSIGVSNLSAAYFYADIVMLIPAGLILDRMSTRKLLLIAIAACALSSLIFAAAHSYWIAFAARLLIGLGSAFALLASIRLASRWFPAEKLALISGLVVTMAMLGGAVAQTPLSLLVDAIGWRAAVICDAMLGLTFLLVIYKTVFDYPDHYQAQHASNMKQLKSLPWNSLLKKIFSNRQNWVAGLFTSLLNLPIMVMGGLWGTPYLQAVEGFTKTQASVVSSMLFIGTIFGSPILGRLSDRIGLRRIPMIVFGFLSLGMICIILYVHDMGFWPMLLLFLALGFITSAQILTYPLIAESNPKSITSGAMGLSSFIIMAGGAVFQPLVGWLLNLHWLGETVAGTPVYSAADFSSAFIILPITFAVAILAAFLVKETYCKAYD